MPSFNDILIEMKSDIKEIDNIRKKYISKLSSLLNRNIIVYYSGWLEGKNINSSIEENDIIRLIPIVNDLDKTKGLDLILHTPGGELTATEGIIKYLNSSFKNDIRVFVPHMAMSSGTLLSCSSKTIVLSNHSFLGPVDPQTGDASFYNLLDEYEELKNKSIITPDNNGYLKTQSMKYPPGVKYKIIDTINLASNILSLGLGKYMFCDMELEEKAKIINKIVNALNSNNNSHSRHFDYYDCKELGLKVELMSNEEFYEDAVMSVYYSYKITVILNQVSKIIENSAGNSSIC